MQITVVKNKEEWDGWFLQKPESYSFAQSWAWGDILIAEGKKVERLAIVENDAIIVQAQVVYNTILFGWQYGFCPKGPGIAISDNQEIITKIFETAVEYLKKKCIFLRTEPPVNFQFAFSIFQKTTDVNPSATLILDLGKTESELLSGMHQKTRYNIHLAEKKNLTISREKDLKIFLKLMNKTGKRDKFSLHDKEHYAKVLESPMIYQLTAYEQHRPVAVAVFTHFGNTFTYLYGASDHAHRNLMAPYLLQWEGIKMGKSLGCLWYDFFGVAPRVLSNSQNSTDYIYDDKHQYAGVTRFKLGFGGVPYEAAGTFDLVIDKKKYKIYTLLRWLRRLF